MSNWPLGVISSAGGGASSFALWSWGLNAHGQLGHGGTTRVSSPVQVGTDEDWVNAQGGQSFTLAIRSNGTLWGFGQNNFGQLGDNSTTNRSSPVQIGSDEDWVDAILSPNQYGCSAVKADGTLWTWGNSGYGELGHGNTDNVCVPTQVGSETGWADCSMSSHTSGFIKQNGTLFTTGRGFDGSLANNGDNSVNFSTPVQVGSLTNWKLLCGKHRGFISVKTDGTLWSWGSDEQSVLGNGGSDVNVSSPIQIGSDTDWKEPFSNGETAGCLKTSGDIWGWGRGRGGGWQHNTQNSAGATDSSIPHVYENVEGEGGDTDWQGDHRIRSCTGGRHNGTVKSGNELYMWGEQSNGELGIGSTTRTHSPVQIGGSWYRVGTGFRHTVALKR